LALVVIGKISQILLPKIQIEGIKIMTNATANLLYSKEHEWVLQLDGNRVRIGISDYAQKQLGDIVFAESPAVGDEVTADEPMGTIESVKAVSELYAPVSGTVVRVNEELNDTPEVINENPYEAGWLVEVEISNPEELVSLLNEGEYQAFINEGEE
jgi:glycine cleavage system H protein